MSDDARAAAEEGVATLNAAYKHATAVAGRPLDFKAWLSGDESVAKLPAGPAFRVRTRVRAPACPGRAHLLLVVACASRPRSRTRTRPPW